MGHRDSLASKTSLYMKKEVKVILYQQLNLPFRRKGIFLVFFNSSEYNKYIEYRIEYLYIIYKLMFHVCILNALWSLCVALYCSPIVV